MRPVRLTMATPLLAVALLLAACSSSTSAPATTAHRTTTTVAPTTTVPPTTTSTTVPLTGFVGTWSTHDGSITIAADGTGQLEWPGATPPEGVPQVATITVAAKSPVLATVTVTSGRLVYVNPATGHAGIAYGPGSTFGLAPTSFGLDLVISDLHHYYFCTAAERQAGTDQQYCGA